MVISGPGLRAFCFTSLCLTLFICDVGIIVALWTHRKCAGALFLLLDALAQMVSPPKWLSAPWWRLCSVCSVTVLELVSGRLSPLPTFCLFSAHPQTSLPSRITKPCNQGFIKLYIPFATLHLAGT